MCLTNFVSNSKTSKTSFTFLSLLIKNEYWQQEKTEFINKLRDIKDILLVFELDTNLTKHIDRFIFNDKKD